MGARGILPQETSLRRVSHVGTWLSGIRHEFNNQARMFTVTLICREREFLHRDKKNLV